MSEERRKERIDKKKNVLFNTSRSPPIPMWCSVSAWRCAFFTLQLIHLYSLKVLVTCSRAAPIISVASSRLVSPAVPSSTFRGALHGWSSVSQLPFNTTCTAEIIIHLSSRSPCVYRFGIFHVPSTINHSFPDLHCFTLFLPCVMSSLPSLPHTNPSSTTTTQCLFSSQQPHRPPPFPSTIITLTSLFPLPPPHTNSSSLPPPPQSPFPVIYRHTILLSPNSPPPRQGPSSQHHGEALVSPAGVLLTRLLNFIASRQGVLPPTLRPDH